MGADHLLLSRTLRQHMEFICYESTCFNFHKSLNNTEADALSRSAHFVAKGDIKGAYFSDCYDV